MQTLLLPQIASFFGYNLAYYDWFVIAWLTLWNLYIWPYFDKPHDINRDFFEEDKLDFVIDFSDE